MTKTICINAILVFMIAVMDLAAQKTEAEQFKYTASLMEGQWHIQASNFDLWTKGDKTHPGNLYTKFKVKGSKLKFDDLLTWDQNGKQKKLKGQLKQKKSDKLYFVWRGKGLLKIFKSYWLIIASDSEGQWIALYSPGTLMSPYGVDVMSRKKLSETEVKKIIAHLDQKYVKKPLQILK